MCEVSHNATGAGLDQVTNDLQQVKDTVKLMAAPTMMMSMILVVKTSKNEANAVNEQEKHDK